MLQHSPYSVYSEHASGVVTKSAQSRCVHSRFHAAKERVTMHCSTDSYLQGSQDPPRNPCMVGFTTASDRHAETWSFFTLWSSSLSRRPHQSPSLN